MFPQLRKGPIESPIFVKRGKNNGLITGFVDKVLAVGNKGRDLTSQTSVIVLKRYAEKQAN